MAEERINYRLNVDGSQQAAREFDTVTSSLTRNSAASQLATRNTAALGSGVAAFGTVVAGANPVIGQFAGVLGTAGGAVSALGGTFGPLGLAVGGAIALIGTLSVAFRDSADDADALSKSVGDLNQSLASNIKLLREQDAERSRRERVELGAGTIREQEAHRDQLLKVQRSLKPALAGEFGEENRRLAERQNRENNRKLRAATEALTDAIEAQRDRVLNPPTVGANLEDLTKAPARAGGGAARRPSGASDADEFFGQVGGVDPSQLQGSIGGPGGDVISGIAGTGTVEESIADAEAAEIDQRLSQWDDYGREREKQIGVLTDREKEEAANRLKLFNKSQTEQERRAKKTQDKLTGFGEQATEAAARAVIGQGDASKAIIAAIGDQMVAEGSKALFSGGIMLAGGNYAGGAATIALGAAEIAAGFGLGATVSAPAGGGQGGNGTPAEPSRFRQGEDRAERTTTVINIDAMVADANAGRRIEQARTEARRSGMIR